MLLDNNIGLLLTHISQRHKPAEGDWIWAADNACFSTNQWDSTRWLRWLESKQDPETALFATIPDVVADHEATLAKWPTWSKRVKDLGYKTAFILQNGATTTNVPWDECDAVFIGGDTSWKLGQQACSLVAEAKRRKLWVHMGRVNSRRRLEIAEMWRCDSVDGTYLAFAPNTNTPKLVEMMKRINHQPSLNELFQR